MSHVDHRTAQRQAAAGAGGQSIDAHLFQHIAHVGIGKVEVSRRKGIGGVLVCADRQPGCGGRVVGAYRRDRRRGRAGQALVGAATIGIADRQGDHLAHIALGQGVACRGRAADGRIRGSVVPVPLIGE